MSPNTQAPSSAASFPRRVTREGKPSTKPATPLQKWRVAQRRLSPSLPAMLLNWLKSAVEDQKASGAGAIGDIARAAKGAADDFQDRAPEIANTVRSVADRVEGISNDIRDRSGISAPRNSAISKSSARLPGCILGR